MVDSTAPKSALETPLFLWIAASLHPGLLRATLHGCRQYMKAGVCAVHDNRLNNWGWLVVCGVRAMHGSMDEGKEVGKGPA